MIIIYCFRIVFLIFITILRRVEYYQLFQIMIKIFKYIDTQILKRKMTIPKRFKKIFSMGLKD